MDFIRISLYVYIIVLCSSLTFSLFPASPLLPGSLSPSSVFILYICQIKWVQKRNCDIFSFPSIPLSASPPSMRLLFPTAPFKRANFLIAWYTI